MPCTMVQGVQELFERLEDPTFLRRIKSLSDRVFWPLDLDHPFLCHQPAKSHDYVTRLACHDLQSLPTEV